MCRWITLLSAEQVSLSDVVLAPANSLVQLSKDASFHPGYGDMNNHVMNGDGFGVGWYHTNVAICPYDDHLLPIHQTAKQHPSAPYPPPTPRVSASVFKDTLPAWNNANLRELCLATRSNCMLAHVRAASKNTGVSQANCHPFKAGRLLFCHNGRIDNFGKIRRAILSKLTDEVFIQVRGTTDSEAIFALILTFLSQDGKSDVSPLHQTEPFGHKRIANAIKKTLRAIEVILHEAYMTDGFCTFNFSCTDGDTVVVTRYCDKSPQVPPPSLYFAFGDAQRMYHELTSEDPVSFVSQQSQSDDGSLDHSTHDGNSDTEDSFDERAVGLADRTSRPGSSYAEVDPASACFIVASNPLTKTHTWHRMPKNSIMWYTRGELLPELRLLRVRARTMSVYESMLVQDVASLLMEAAAATSATEFFELEVKEEGVTFPVHEVVPTNVVTT